MMTKKINMLLGYAGISKAELAKRLSMSSQNLYNKLGRDNFSERELHDIAKACGAKLEIHFVADDGTVI